jgi:hypothetical protein
MALAALGNVAAVTQLVGNAGGLISKIIKGAKTARQNKVDCERLASRVSTIGGVLSRLPWNSAEMPSSPGHRSQVFTLKKVSALKTTPSTRPLPDTTN